MKRNNTLPANTATVTSLVLPEQLAHQAADAVRELLAEAAAANTTRSYATALRYWAGWHQGRYGIELALPVSEAVVIQFLVGFYPDTTDGCERVENFKSCLAVLRRILGLWNRSMYSNTSVLAASSVGYVVR